MRQTLALLAILLAGTLGCTATNTPAESTSWLHRPEWFRGVEGSDVIQVEAALVEAPLADPALADDLWRGIDEQVPLEQKASLANAGVRLGLAGAMPPPQLRPLLTSERHCINPHRRQLRSGTPHPSIPLGPKKPRVTVAGREFEQAQFLVSITPSLVGNQRIRVRIEPRIRHARPRLLPWKPSHDRSGWVIDPNGGEEALPEASWEIDTPSGEWIVLGARETAPESLGGQCFLGLTEKPPMRRLLLLRVSRLDAGADLQPWTEPARTARVPPLALQASYSFARGVAPEARSR